MANEAKSIIQGRREPKHLRVETYSSELGVDKGLFKQSNCKVKHEVKKEKVEKVDDIVDIISFVSGNPFVEITRGILHLYKEK